MSNQLFVENQKELVVHVGRYYIPEDATGFFINDTGLFWFDDLKYLSIQDERVVISSLSIFRAAVAFAVVPEFLIACPTKIFLLEYLTHKTPEQPLRAIGDRCTSAGQTYMIARVPWSKIQLTNLQSGNCWSRPIEVAHDHRITPDEITRLLDDPIHPVDWA